MEKERGVAKRRIWIRKKGRLMVMSFCLFIPFPLSCISPTFCLLLPPASFSHYIISCSFPHISPLPLSLSSRPSTFFPFRFTFPFCFHHSILSSIVFPSFLLLPFFPRPDNLCTLSVFSCDCCCGL